MHKCWNFETYKQKLHRASTPSRVWGFQAPEIVVRRCEKWRWRPCSQTAQISTDASSLNQKWSRIPIQIYGLIRSPCRSGCLPDCSQTVVDSLACRRQPFCQVSWKSAGDCTRCANNLLQCPIPQWWSKWKSDAESISRTVSPPTVNKFFRLVGPIITPCFNTISWLILQLYYTQTCIMTARRNDSQSDLIPRHSWQTFHSSPPSPVDVAKWARK